MWKQDWKRVALSVGLLLLYTAAFAVVLWYAREAYDRTDGSGAILTVVGSFLFVLFVAGGTLWLMAKGCFLIKESKQGNFAWAGVALFLVGSAMLFVIGLVWLMYDGDRRSLFQQSEVGQLLWPYPPAEQAAALWFGLLLAVIVAGVVVLVCMVVGYKPDIWPLNRTSKQADNQHQHVEQREPAHH